MKRASELNAYEYLAKHLIGKRPLYEQSFEIIKGHLGRLKPFRSLNALIAFTKYRGKDERERIKQMLFQLGKKAPVLRPSIVGILMFVLWDDLTERYGMGDRFADSYWDLIQELENTNNCE